jgi:allantoicase
VTGFTAQVDLAARGLGGGVIAASDEFFGAKEDLLRPGPPVFEPRTFGPKGQVVDGWETRRRRPGAGSGPGAGTGPAGSGPGAGRDPGEDFALVRLGAAGVIRDVVVDTTHFTGNFPAACSVQACAVDGSPGPAELLGPGVAWAEIVPRSELAGDTENRFAVADGRRFTHVRLTIYPDGGVARLRVHGEVIPDPRLLDGMTLDLAALENGGTVADASDRFYSPPENMIAPGLAATMGDGWETRRRRGPGNDWVVLRLAEAGLVRQVAVDTSCFLGNAPATARLRACDATATGLAAAAWFDLLPRTALQPDTRHRFRTGPAGPGPRPATHVRLDIYPDGGLARLRLYGELTADGRARLGVRWFDRLPGEQAIKILNEECGLATAPAAELAARRPYEEPGPLAALLAGGRAHGAVPGGEAPGAVPGLDAAAARRARSLLLGS